MFFSLRRLYLTKANRRPVKQLMKVVDTLDQSTVDKGAVEGIVIGDSNNTHPVCPPVPFDGGMVLTYDSGYQQTSQAVQIPS
jgi:hypothetical protein